MTNQLSRLPSWAWWLLGSAVALLAGLAVAGPSALVDYVVRGFPLGCVFALMAVGIVLTFKTSGVLNLAFAAQAFVSATVFYELRANHEWPLALAFLVAVVLISPLIGLILDRFLFRHLRSAPQLARLVISLGLLVAIPQAVQIIFSGSTFNPPALGNLDRIYRFGDYALDGNQLTTIVITVALVAALSAMFRWSSIGLRMRAVVESPRMAELNGINADRVSAFSWALSSFFAGLAGVLLAPLFAQVELTNFFTLLVAALAAAAFGRLSSVPMTFAGAILLAVLMQLLGGELPEGNIITQNLRPALPFVTLILLLLFWPGLRQRREISDPLGGVEPPPPAPAAAERPRGLTIATRALAVAVVGGFLYLAFNVLDDFWLGRMTTAVILATIFLSITVITGMGGLVSLCQATFAAVGAFATTQAVNAWGLDVLTSILVGTLIAAVVGALLALPALRLSGIYLALVTLAFAVAFEFVFVPQGWVSGGTEILRVPRPTLGPFDFADDRSYLVLCMVFLAIVAVAVILIRGGTTGRFLDALRGSETAAMSIGINPARSKFVAFSASAAIAGFGGGLLVSQRGTSGSSLYQAEFGFFLGLVWVVLAVTLGARSVQAAITGGVAFILMPEILDTIGFDPQWAIVLFGLGALTYARNPEGVIEANTRKSLQLIARLRARDETEGPGDADERVGATERAAVAPVGGGDR